MVRWFERHTIAVHLVVMFAGFVAFAVAVTSGEWRLLFVTALAWWFTVRTS
jgi:hypothetical protein